MCIRDSLYNYEYCGILADSDGSIGNMWECPNFTKIESTDVLIFSPKGLGKHFPVPFESGYMTGTMDYVNEKFEHGPYHTLDQDVYKRQLLSVYRSEASVTRFLFTPKTHCCIMRKTQKKTLHMSCLLYTSRCV